MYGITDYGRMLADRVRVDAYRRALAAVVKPGALVVDLGAGTGFFALEACRLGAAKVLAIETNEAVNVLPALARKNGFTDRIEVIARSSTEVTLERRADVVVADLRGVVPLYLANLAVMEDARARLLAPGGVMIPERDVLHVAVASAPELYASVTGGWEGHGLDLEAARLASVSTFHNDRRHPIGAAQLVTPGDAFATVVYGEPAPPLVERVVKTTATRSATAHGLVLWFDATLHGDIGYTTAPGNDRVYGRGFLPWERPVAVEAGDVVTLDLAVRRGMGDHVWAWGTTIHRGGVVQARMQQTTFFGVVASAASIGKESSSHRPTLGPRGRATSAALAAMDGGSDLAEIARRLRQDHPGVFASDAEALEEVRRLARKYT